MDSELFRAIKRARHEFNKIADIEETIMTTAQCRAATEVLLDALHDATLKHEELWQAIEQMPVFKEKYGTDRERACDDFFIARAEH